MIQNYFGKVAIVLWTLGNYNASFYIVVIPEQESPLTISALFLHKWNELMLKQCSRNQNDDKAKSMKWLRLCCLWLEGVGGAALWGVWVGHPTDLPRAGREGKNKLDNFPLGMKPRVTWSRVMRTGWAYN